MHHQILEGRAVKQKSSIDGVVLCLLILGGGFLIFRFLFVWIYTNIDGYFYWAIGEYFRTGIYPFIAPFIYNKPITISPPLYGLFLAFIGTIPHGDRWLHLSQIVMMATTTLLLYHILTSWITKRQAAIIAFLFLILPTNVIYTSSMMTELPAQTAMTLYLFLLQKSLKTNHTATAGHLLVLTALMTLLKYQFIILFMAHTLYFLWLLYKKSPGAISLILYATVGTLIISLWIVTNHGITGVWGLSDTKKMPFYTNFVWNGKHYPRETNPAVKALRQYVPRNVDKYAEYWDLQDYILPSVNRNWTAVDELLGNVGIAAINEDPLGYVTNGIRIFFQTHGHRAPWWYNLETFGRRDPAQPLYCDSLRSIRFCKPIIMTSYSYPFWNTYVHFSRTFYDVVLAPILQILFLPLLFIVFLTGQWNRRIFSAIYFVNLVPISYLTMVESRYLIPYYPLIIIITVLGTQSVYIFFRRITSSAK